MRKIPHKIQQKLHSIRNCHFFVSRRELVSLNAIGLTCNEQFCVSWLSLDAATCLLCVFLCNYDNSLCILEICSVETDPLAAYDKDVIGNESAKSES